MKKAGKLILLLMALIMTLSTTSSVHAEESRESQYYVTMENVAGDQYCSLSVTKGASFSLVIPKKIILSGDNGEENSASYSVTVIADISGTDSIHVIPEESFTLSQIGKPDRIATVLQDMTSFGLGTGVMTEEELLLGYTTNGSVSSQGLSAGTWNGSFMFYVSFSEMEY